MARHSLRIRFIVFVLLSNASIGTSALSSRPFKIEKSKLSHVNESTTTSPASTTSTTGISTTIPSTAVITSTTAVPTTTASLAPTTTTKPTLKPKEGKNSTSPKPSSTSTKSHKTAASGLFCECDLRVTVCEINCCCDADCTLDMLKAFDCSIGMRPEIIAGTYEQGLPSCKLNDGWLCIFKDNSKKQVIEVYDAERKFHMKHKWPNSFPDEDEVEHDREFYMAGDEIMIYLEPTEEFRTLDLPYPLLSSYCHISEPIRHLKEITRKCVMTPDDSQTFFDNFIETIAFAKLLRNRSEIDTKKLPIERSHYVDFNVSLCKTDEDFSHCHRIRNDSVYSSEACWKLDIFIYHNFTNLTGIHVFLTCDGNEDDLKSFNVKFLQPNETQNYTLTNVSGKYGYRPGSPVIIGKYIDVTEDVNDNERKHVISYFHSNQTVRDSNKVLVLPKTISGACSNETEGVVNFNENSLTQCMLMVANSSVLTAETNYTNFCISLQSKAFHYLINDENFTGTFPTYVSELGWPLNDSRRWIHMETRNFDVRQSIEGSFISETNSFRCQNMILSVRYEFVTARITVGGVHRQNAIKKSTVEFGNRLDLQFKLDEELTLPLYTYVMFYDATANGSSQIFIILNTFLVTFVILFI